MIIIGEFTTTVFGVHKFGKCWWRENEALLA